MDDQNKGIKDILQEIRKRIEGDELETLALLWWNIWYKRNKTIFDHANVKTEAELLSGINALIMQWKRAKKQEQIDKIEGKITSERSPKNRSQRRDWSGAKWCPPMTGFIKVNFDGSVIQNESSSWGCIFRNALGEVLHVAAARGLGPSPLMSEGQRL